MTFVTTAKFVITSIWSAQKFVNRVFFSLISHFILHKNISFVYLLELPWRGDFNKHTKRMIYKKKCSKVSVTDALNGFYQVSL